jgi:hypothetical protein
MIELMAGTGIVFWVFWFFVMVVAVLDFVAVASDDEGMYAWAIFMTSVGAGYVFFFADASWGTRLMWLAIGGAVYFLVGVVWSIKKYRDFLIEYRRNAQASGGDKWRDSRSMPKASENKTRIVGYMALWPFSMTWWVLTWPRHAFVWAFNRLRDRLDAMAKHIWEN